MSTYPCYIPPQTPACTFDALTFSPGFFYETLMHPPTRSGSPHNALHSSSYAICCKSTNHQLQCLHSLSADYLFHMIDHSREISHFSGNQERVGGGTNKLQLFIQWHSQLATAISKGFYNNIQCGCGVCMRGGTISPVVDVKKISLCCGAITTLVAY